MLKKTVRVLLYVLLIVTLTGAITAVLLFAGKERDSSGRDAETMVNAGEENEGPDGTDHGTGRDTVSEIAAEADSETLETEDNEKTGATENGESVSGTTEDSGVAESDVDTVLVFAGDVMLDGPAAANYDAKGITGVVSDDLLAELTGADIFMANHEFAMSSRGTAMEDKEYTYRCDPGYVKILQELGVDIVSLANNHTLDFGKEALSDTFTTLDRAGILYGGAGETKERAEEIQVIEKNGMKFGFVAGSRVIPVTDWNVENSQPGLFTVYDYSRLVEVVAEAEKECDFVTVYLHWGVERVEYPEEYEREMAKACIAAGADLIVGGHSHCLQGVEFIDGVPVFYALGDFIFVREASRSALVEVTVDSGGNASYRFLPTYTTGGTTYYMDETKTAETWRYMESISWGMTIDENGVIHQ